MLDSFTSQKKISPMKYLQNSLLFSFFILFSGLNAQVNFQFVDFDFAKKTAFNSGKSFFVYFASADCMDCKEMKKTTFTNPELGAMVKSDFNAYKVDINSISGSNWVNKFAIYNGPVFLFFDKNGNMMQRIEHALTADNLQKILADPSSYHDMKSEFASSEENSSENTEAVTANYITETTDISSTDEFDFLNNSEATSSETSTGGYDHSTTYETEVVESEPSTNYSSESGNFTVQTGIFITKKYADRMVKDIVTNYDLPVRLKTEIIDGKTHHRVLVGKFTDEKSAEELNSMLKRDGRDAFVKKQ